MANEWITRCVAAADKAHPTIPEPVSVELAKVLAMTTTTKPGELAVIARQMVEALVTAACQPNVP